MRDYCNQKCLYTFTGDVSMDVVCFIWDQCFIGLGIGGYQYIPYLIAVLLLIMKEPLLQCKEVSFPQKTDNVMSPHL